MPFRPFLFSLLSLSALLASPAQAFESNGRSAYVVDHRTGTVLLRQAADIPMPPASMSKLMTINMLFEALRDGRVTMDTEFRVSGRASAMGGSKMFLRDGERVAIRDLIPGIIVHSGNDACVVVAEGLAGTEDAFARNMNERAAALGMTGSTFANASGWPNPNHRMTAEDLGLLARRMIEDFPEYYGYFAQEEFTWAGITQKNRNPLLALGVGADGLKTGHTSEAGYGLVGSALQGNRRVTFVLSGLASEAARAEEAERVINWSFRQFSEKTIGTKGERIASAPVWMGSQSTVDLVLPEDLVLLIPALVRDDIAAQVTYTGPLQAPIAAGQQVATLVVTLPDLGEIRRPLVAGADVPRGGFLVRIKTAARVLYAQITSEGQAAN